MINHPPTTSTYAHAIYAIKPIAKGEEITFNYDTDSYYQTTEIRRNVGSWDFICNCRACNVNDPFHYVSDMRRVLLRGLLYLMNGGQDAPGWEGSKVPVTQEAEKAKYTQMEGRSLSFKDAEKIAMWNVLSGYLAEAEGIAIMASGNFQNAAMVTLTLCGQGPVEMQKTYRDDAYRWATYSLSAIKSCRPADHVDVQDRARFVRRLHDCFFSCASVTAESSAEEESSTEEEGQSSTEEAEEEESSMGDPCGVRPW